MEWYLLKTKPRQEFRAKEHLENQQLTTYLPILTRKDKRAEALFPGYIFLAADADPSAMGAVRSTRGVMGFVRFGSDIATASDYLIQDIQMLENRFRHVPTFLPGQTVECKSGPFAGLRGIFESENGKDRCIILLTLLNSPRQVVVSQKVLQAVS